MNCKFVNNYSPIGGSIYLYFPGNLIIKNCLFVNNTAYYGSSIYFEQISYFILNYSIFIFCLDYNSNDNLSLELNKFEFNKAYENGACIYIYNKNSTSFINIFSNNLTNNSIQNLTKKNLGSAIYLEDPGRISIIRSIFYLNYGLLGTCIYYSETSNDFVLELTLNEFNSNFAIRGAAGIFLKNHFEKITLATHNIFKNNKASYANDYSTTPFRLEIKNKNFKTSKKITNLIIVPGITNLQLDFQFLDYFGQLITNLDEDIPNTIQIKNSKTFTNKVDHSLKLYGQTVVYLLNSIKIKILISINLFRCYPF